MTMIGVSPAVIESLRAAAILVLLVVLAFWTIRRVAGDGTDPNVSIAESSDTGSVTFLVSGTNAVALAVGLIALFAWETVASTPLFAVGLAGIVVLHWVIETRERSGSLFGGGGGD